MLGKSVKLNFLINQKKKEKSPSIITWLYFITNVFTAQSMWQNIVLSTITNINHIT